MAVVTSGNWQKALWPGVHGWFNDSYEAWPEEYTQVFSVLPSGKAFEQVVGQSLLGLPAVKDQGNPITYDDTQQTYVNQWTHAVYALGVILTLEAYKDNQYNLDALKKRPAALARSMREGKEVIHANVLNRAFNSAYTMGSTSDGVELCSAAHLNGPYGANSSNLLTAADLSETTLEDAVVSVNTMTDPRGHKIKVTADTLIIPPNSQFIAERILASTLQNDTANNAINALRSKNAIPGGYIVNHYLTDTDSWFLTTSVNKGDEGLVSFDAWPTEFGMDNEFDTFNMKCKAFFRLSAGWGDFRAIFGNAGA